MINTNLSNCKTLGRCPNTPPVFEKTGQKLLSKRNYIAFYGNPFAIFLKPSLEEGLLTAITLHF